MSGVWYGYGPAQPQAPSNEEVIRIKESVHQASVRLSKWRKKEMIALDNETRRQSELVLEERLRWREALKGQRREMVERYVDERRLISRPNPQVANLLNGYLYKSHNYDIDNIHSDHYNSENRLECEKFLNRNIFGHANDDHDDDYGYFLDTRRDNRPVTGILGKFIQDHKEIKKVKSEDDNSQIDSPIVNNDEIDNKGTFKLIDAMFLLGPHDDDVNRVCLLNPLSTVTERVEPHILFECGTVPGVETEVLPFFSFPSGVEVVTSSSSKRSTKSFVFVLASHTYSQYAICMIVPRTFKDPANPSSDRLITTEYSICVVTRLPFISYIMHILYRSDLMGWIFPNLKEPIQASDNPREIIPSILYSLNDLANRLRRIKVLFEMPEDPVLEADDCLLKYDSIELTLPWRSVDGVNQMKNKDTFTLPRDKHAELFYTQIQSRVEIMQVRRPLLDRENTFYTLMWSLPILLKHLPLEEIMLVLGCALTEMRVIVHATDLNVVSGCLLALANLLRPLKWAGVIIVTLPSSSLYMNYLESPVPMIVGMQQLPSDFQLKDGTVIVDPLHNAAHKAVQLHSKDVVESHTLTLPHTSIFMKSLKDQAENILRTSKKYNRMADALGGDARNSAYKVPIDLDATSDDGQLFLSSVSAFVSILEVHLTTVVNTAVFLTREQTRQQKLKANQSKSQSIDSFRHKNLVSIDAMDDQSEVGDTHSDVGDNKSQLSIASDDSEALPPMEKDAPRLNTRGQNDSNLLFVQRLMATQMFEDYCHIASETHKKAVAKAKTVTNAAKTNITDHVTDVTTHRLRRYSADNSGIVLKNAFNNTDSLVSLFITILSGSVPITEEQLQQMIDSINENESQEGQSREMFCNGRCGGMANTPLCTSLCVTLWQQHVYIEAQKQKMQELLIKHRNSKFVVARKKLLGAVPRIRPVQHPRETDSQYMKRCGTIIKDIDNEMMNESALVAEIDYEQQSPKVTTALKQLSKYYVNRELLRIDTNRRREEFELQSREIREKSTVKIQTIARGYFVRRDTLKLFNKLVEAKLSVMGSKIKARNILRKAMARRQFMSVTVTVDDFNQDQEISSSTAPIGVKSPSSISKKTIAFEAVESKPSLNNDKSNRLLSQPSLNKEKTKTLHLGERATKALSKFFRSVVPERNSSSSRNVGIKRNSAIDADSAQAEAKKGALKADVPKKSDTKLVEIKKSSDTKLSMAPQMLVDTKNEASPSSDDSYNQTVKQPWKEATIMKTGSVDEAFEYEVTSDVSTVINMPSKGRDIKMSSSNILKSHDVPVLTEISPESKQDKLASLSKPKALLELDTEEDIDENNDDIYFSPPIVSLGAPAKISLTLQQHLIVIEMWSLLRKGVTILKHGLSGKPRLRFLYCDSTMSTLYWREHSLGPNPETPVWKNRRSSFLKDDNDRRLYFKDIIEVRADQSTEVMMRSASKQYTYSNDDTAFISIILADRTFDIEVQVDQWDALFHAFQILTNYYRVLLPNFSMKS